MKFFRFVAQIQNNFDACIVITKELLVVVKVIVISISAYPHNPMTTYPMGNPTYSTSEL